MGLEEEFGGRRPARWWGQQEDGLGALAVVGDGRVRSGQGTSIAMVLAGGEEKVSVTSARAMPWWTAVEAKGAGEGENIKEKDEPPRRRPNRPTVGLS